MLDYDWRTVGDSMLRLLKSNQGLLSHTTVEHVKNYVAADEYEMTLEGLCLDLMHNPDLLLSDLEELGVLAKQVALDKESVYDPEFWTHFAEALEAKRLISAASKA
ncbi:MAG: hypothetical protein ABI193_17245 [Minicystis sp.]